MKYANVQLNWNTTFQVPVSDLSKFLEMMQKYPLVKNDYDDQAKEYYDYLDSDKTPSILLVDKPAEQSKRVQPQTETA
jgi:hypothetical protein